MGEDELIQQRRNTLLSVSQLFENNLNRKAPVSVNELWEEHKLIRKTLENKKKNGCDTDDILLSRKRTAETLNSFMSWASQIGIKSESVSISSWNNTDFQLKASRLIKSGETVVSVPRHAMISLDLAKRSAIMKKAFEKDPIVQRMDNVGLALFLCCQRLKPDSKWNSYLNILPTTFSTPLCYSEEDLLNLKPSPIFEESLLFYRTVARQFCYFFIQVSKNDLYEYARKRKATNEAPPPLYNTPLTVDNFTFNLFRWAVCCVTTRVNMLPSENERNRDGTPRMIPALIPLLDMANHEFVPSVESNPVSYEAESDCGEIVAARDYKESEPVTIFYGPRSNADHLLHNGFVPIGENPHDRYKLKIALPRNDKLFEKKFELISNLGFNDCSESNIFVYDINSSEEPFHPTLENFARIFVSSELTDEILNSPETLVKAVSFLKNRFYILERSYGDITEGSTEVEKTNSRLKQGELVIITNARKYCEKWEQSL